MFCENCGKEITENDVFCPKCGTKIVVDNNQSKCNQKNQQNTDYNNTYQYKRPEKVRFSERWLLVKLCIISFFLNAGISEVFQALGEIEYVEAFGIFLVSGVLAYWLFRNYKYYAGNPYMLKFSIKDETVISVSKKIKTAKKVIDVILIVAWIITAITYIGDTGFLSMITWVVLPASEVGPWIPIAMVLTEADYIILSHRPYQWAVDYELFEEEEKEN